MTRGRRPAGAQLVQCLDGSAEAKRRLWLIVERPGSIWAIDFAEPPSPVDGCYVSLLAVRDLASGCQLLWLPVAAESARTAIDALAVLFRQHGPPLVLKSDNGAAFIAGEIQQFLTQWTVWQLRSPPRWPAYNGSCEAGIGSMKVRTQHAAARHGRAGEWTCDDVEAGRLQANETGRPWGVRGPTPDEAWGGRLRITPAERAAFGATVQRLQDDARVTEGYPADGPLTANDRAAIDRVALSRALVSHELLDFTQRTVPPR